MKEHLIYLFSIKRTSEILLQTKNTEKTAWYRILLSSALLTYPREG